MDGACAYMTVSAALWVRTQNILKKQAKGIVNAVARQKML
jgi:hypothetical protein